MLEVKWKELLNYNRLYAYPGFNPCYVGSKMESNGYCHLNFFQRGFNPCYVGSKMESF